MLEGNSAILSVTPNTAWQLLHCRFKPIYMYVWHYYAGIFCAIQTFRELGKLANFSSHILAAHLQIAMI